MHTIRLRGPWEYQVLFDDKQPDVKDLPSGRINAPIRWRELHGADFQGHVCYQRSFNLPTGLSDSTVIRLHVGDVELVGILLNGNALTDQENGSMKSNLRSMLEPANRLELKIQLPMNADVLLENIRLEIIEPT